MAIFLAVTGAHARTENQRDSVESSAGAEGAGQRLGHVRDRVHLSEVVNRVSNQPERVTVTVHGRASVVLLAPEDLERLEETIAVLADSDLLRQLAQADADASAGHGETADELVEPMRHRRP